MGMEGLAFFFAGAWAVMSGASDVGTTATATATKNAFHLRVLLRLCVLFPVKV